MNRNFGTVQLFEVSGRFKDGGQFKEIVQASYKREAMTEYLRLLGKRDQAKVIDITAVSV